MIWRLVSALLFLAPLAEARAEVPFLLTSPDTLRRTGLFTSLALDARGEPWIAYYDGTAGDLKVAHRRHGEWTIETVDARGFTGGYPSIALDAAGAPQVCYTAELLGDLRFAWREAGVWRRETVDDRPHGRAFGSLALGADGVPRFVYHSTTERQLQFFERRPGGWSRTVVDEGFNMGFFASMAATSDGAHYVSYYDGVRADLRLAIGWNGAWSRLVVDSVGATGAHTSLRLDSRELPRIAYMDLSRRLVRLAWRKGTQWHFDTVDTVSADAVHTALALDDQDRAWIVYLPGDGGLRLARQTAEGWVRESVETRGGRFPSLVLDAQMNPRVSYYDTTGSNLGYADAAVHLVHPQGSARWPAGSLQTVQWEGRGTVEVEVSLDGGSSYAPSGAVSSTSPLEFVVPEGGTENARLRLVRRDPPSSSESPGLFELASDLASPWWSEAADDAGFPGRGAAIAVAGRKPWVAHRSVSDGTLRVTRREDTGWVHEQVGGAYFGEGSLDFAVDPESGAARLVASADAGLLYLTNDGGAWTTEVVAAAASPAVALRLGPDGAPRLAYFGAGTVRLATREDAAWRDETVHAASPTSALGLAVDAAGRSVVAFFDATLGRLRVAESTGGSWTSSLLTTSGFFPSRLAAAFGAGGRPMIAAASAHQGSVLLFEWDGGFWLTTEVAAPGSGGEAMSLAVDAAGEPWIAYDEPATGRPWVAHRRHGVWWREPADAGGRVGPSLSLALDADGQARLAYFDLLRGELRYVSSAIEQDGSVAAAAPWPVGAERPVGWRGTGRVRLAWRDSTGAEMGEPQFGAAGALNVSPPVSDRSLWLELTRAVPPSFARAAEPIRFQEGVRLVAWLLQVEAGGVRLAWRTEPPAIDLAGYRIERRGPGEDWSLLTAEFRYNMLVDPAGRVGVRYRLSAVDATGALHPLGEKAMLPAERLSVWPSPWRSGPLFVGLRSGGEASARVALFDPRGRRVRELWRGPLAAGEHLLEWDGRDDAGRAAAAGVYFLEWIGSSGRERQRVVRLR